MNPGRQLRQCKDHVVTPLCMKAATREWGRGAEEPFEVANALVRRRIKTEQHRFATQVSRKTAAFQLSATENVEEAPATTRPPSWRAPRAPQRIDNGQANGYPRPVHEAHYLLSTV